MKRIIVTAGLILAGLGINAKPVKYMGGIQTDTVKLYEDTCYVVTSCWVFEADAVLEIEAGTTVRFNDGLSLIMERGSKIFALGTALAPITFTSNKATHLQGPGDWGGVLINGRAANNIVNGGGGEVDIYRCGAYRSGGGSTVVNNDNSGTIAYLRVFFAGAGGVGDEETHGLVLNSVGDATVIENVQVADCSLDGIMLIGGTVNLKNVMTLNVYKDDLSVTYGNTSKIQSLLAIRNDHNAHHSSGSYGMRTENNPAGNINTPLTRPVISNASLMGPLFCDPEASVSGNFKSGILFNNNGGADIYNSLIAGYPEYGVYIADVESAKRTAANTLNISYTSFSDNLIGDYSHDLGFAWSNITMCSNTMGDWIEFMTTGCSDPGNNFSSIDMAYDASFCEDFCENEFVTNFVLDALSSELIPTSFSSLSNFFDSLVFRGAVQDFSVWGSWVEPCPLNEVYCVAEQPKSVEKAMLHLYPNPSQQYTEVGFESAVTGKAVVSIVDRVSGRVLQTATVNMTDSGKQRIKLYLQNLPDNIYLVRVAMPDQILHAQLVVKQ